MENLLSRAKKSLIGQATDLYEFRRDEVELDLTDYQVHYQNLGALIYQIEKYQSFGDIIKDIEDDNLNELGWYGADNYCIENFLEMVKNYE
jgi:hypothetical protein